MRAGEEIGSGRGPGARIIKRSRLTRLLDAAEARVIVLVAPAGYGKTTLAEQWLEGRPAVWYRANPSASDVAALSNSLADALAPVVPNVRRRLDAWLKATGNPEANALAAARILAEEVRGWPDDAWLVIDDFHLIEEDDATRALFARFEAESAINLLITARRRPSWTSARRLLYGEILEVGASALAMTADEADAVLQAATAASPPGLVALAEGWPAVIGLAALAGQTNAPPDTVVPKALYDFFAEELFQTAAPDVRRDLCLLAPAAKVDRPLARHVLGDEHGDCVVEESARLGFFAGTPADSFTIHPLLRDFLLTKAKEYDESARLSAVGLIVGYWLSQHAWDDAFVAISDGGRPDLVPVLVEASLDDIVESGRTASLRRWITVADDHEISSPLLYLAQAEIAYREGLNARAELLALQAAEQLDPSVRFYARAYLRAGRAAHFIDRGEEALAHFVRARETSTDTGTRREALWGSFVTAVDIEDPRMGDFLAEYERAATDEVDDVVRGATGRLSLEYRFGSVYAAIHGARRFVSLISDVKNPLIRTAFWNVYGWAFVLGGRYSEAFLPAEALVTDAKEYSVAFAVSTVNSSAHTRFLGSMSSRERGESQMT
jgi:ATP/maltotriose-dependent transcriptional regulator MalT